MMKMKINKFIILPMAMALASCSTQRLSSNEEQVARKGEAYVSPNQKVEIEILVQRRASSSPDSSVAKGLLKAGSIVPQHVHAESDEFLIFLRGAGELIVDGNTYHVKDGDVVLIPKGKTHSYVNRSGKDASFYQIYTPAGPEQRFKEWSKR